MESEGAKNIFTDVMQESQWCVWGDETYTGLCDDYSSQRSQVNCIVCVQFLKETACILYSLKSVCIRLW